MSKLKTLLRLPMTLKFRDNIHGVVEEFHERDLNEAFNLVETAKRRGGLGVDEVPNIDYFMDHLKNTMALTTREASTKALMAIVTIKQGVVARSPTSPSHSGYTIIDPNFSRHGIGMTLIEKCMSVAAINFGYGYLVGRTSAINPAIANLGKTGMSYLGTIPKSTYFDGVGWVDDLICYIDYGRHLGLQKSVPLPRPPCPPVPFDSNPFPSRSHVFNCGTNALIRVPRHDELVAVNALFKRAAEREDGYATDEFDDNGNYRAKMLQKMNYICAFDDNNDVIACLVYGPSLFCRTEKPQQLGWYAIVKEKYRALGIGYEFVQMCIDYVATLGYAGILADPFICDVAAIRLANKLGFKVCASMPASGVMKNNRLVDSLLFSLSFQKYANL